MCLLILGQDAHPDYALVIAANRDEYYARPSAPARFWTDVPHVLAGRDLRHGGTWLGMTRQGRFAALTNFRDPSSERPGRPTRGQLVTECLRSKLAPGQYLRDMDRSGIEFNGFSLLAGDAHRLFYYSNRDRNTRPIAPGIHALSNHLLGTAWPKTTIAAARFRAALGGEPRHLPDALLDMLADSTVPADDTLPDTGVGLDLERALGAIFVRTPDYGTRCSTVVLIEREGRVRFVERTFASDGSSPSTVCLDFRVQ